MATTTVSLKSLHLLCPGLAEDFQEHLDAAVRDCKQRPSLSQKRVVKLELFVTPHPEDPGDVNIIPSSLRKTPVRKLDPVRARVSARDQLQFDFMEEDM